MTSLVADVLKCTSSGTLDKHDLQNEVIRISQRIESIKLQVFSTLGRCYVEFDPLVFGAFSAEDSLREVVKEADTLKTKIHSELKPQLSSAVSEYEDVSLSIKKSSFLADIVGRLMTLHETLQDSQNSLIVKDYLKASQLLQKAGTDLAYTEAHWKSFGTDDLEILSAIRTEWIVQREKLIFHLGQIWNQHLVWVEQENSYFLRAYSISEGNITNFLKALETLEHLERKLQLFSKSLMAHFVGPILRHETELISNKNSTCIELKIKTVSADHPKAEDVVKSLQTFFEFLSDAFKEARLEDFNTMTLLGKVCAEEFCHRVIKECLEPAVPSQSKDFEAYKLFTTRIKNFENYLKEIDFLSTHQVFSYAQNFDTLFADKRCQEILVQARETMKEDLHCMTFRSALPLDDDLANQCNQNTNQELNKLDDLKHAFSFPKCQISQFTEKILDQLHQVLQEACDSNNRDMATRLFYTAKHLSHMYCDVVPVYHQNSIQLFPQQTALHHNNCMYLAHHLLTLGHGYERALSEKGVEGHKTFVDVSLQLRTIGTEAFLQQMRKQRKILLEFLQDSGVFQNMSSEELLPKGSRAVKQCIIHLLSLRKVWLTVLPWEVYLRSIGTLSNSCLEEIIFRVISQDDITEKTASCLDNILCYLESEMLRLFQWQNSSLDETTGGSQNTQDQEADWRVLCVRHIKKWSKFQELKFLLKSSLRDIVERWASGQGPLASEATAEEVKQLIRALFQNTDRRAAALAKIK